MATKFGAYSGKVIKIDLTRKVWEEYPVNDYDRKMFLGGKILAVKQPVPGTENKDMTQKPPHKSGPEL